MMQPLFKRIHLVSTLLVFYIALRADAQVGQVKYPPPPQPPITATRTPTGFEARSTLEVLRVSVCRDAVLHVVGQVPSANATKLIKPWMLPAADSCPGATFTMVVNADTASLKTAAITFTINLKDSTTSFTSNTGEALWHEGRPLPRTYDPVEVNGEHTYSVTERFSPEATEAFYGLGQHQNGMFNYRGATLELAQNNTDVAIPYLISSKGYGVLWNSAAFTYADNRNVMEYTFNAQGGGTLDYYFVYGPEMDQLVHQYRTLTGHSPMLPQWAYGFFQSKDRYTSTQELLDVAKRYRAEHIPIDAVVQDWYWWSSQGDPEFNANYHDVPGDLKKLHDEHIHAMISVWALLDPRSETYKELHSKGYDLADTHVYDVTNPDAREAYWKRLPSRLLKQGWDAFWLDSSEPEEYWPHVGNAILSNKHLDIGNGATYTNIYPLLHNEGVQQHWKETRQDKRVVLLTRSAFLGQQRTGATTWSGDVYSTFWELKRQIPAGLNFALSGMPYWATDIGGYKLVEPHDEFEPWYQELYTRWFEFGTFCPIFRTHGHREHNEIWGYKNASTLIKYDKLRYRLFPYIYSLAWRVTHDDYTMQRPLVMDWRTDPKVSEIGDQFMFGPSLMVSPILEQDARGRSIYLPKSPAWYDFWTGQKVTGNQRLNVDAPLDVLPLHVPSGSIIPLGPEIEYVGQKPEGPIEVRVYRGADGSFNLYEDSGDGYGYEKGEHSLIPMAWNEASGKLTIGTRQGGFPGMVQKRTFRVVFVDGKHGTGSAESTMTDYEVKYEGKPVTVRSSLQGSADVVTLTQGPRATL